MISLKFYFNIFIGVFKKKITHFCLYNCYLYKYKSTKINVIKINTVQQQKI